MKLYLIVVFLSVLNSSCNEIVSKKNVDAQGFYELNHNKSFDSFYNWTITARPTANAYYMSYSFVDIDDSLSLKAELRLVAERKKDNTYNITYLQEPHDSLVRVFSLNNNVPPNNIDLFIVNLLENFQVLGVESLYSSSSKGYIIFQLRGCYRIAYIRNEAEELLSGLFEKYSRFEPNWYSYDCEINE